MGNETYELTIRSPLVRPGIEIRTNVSRGYLVKTLSELLDAVRDFNKIEQEKHEQSVQER